MFHLSDDPVEITEICRRDFQELEVMIADRSDVQRRTISNLHEQFKNWDFYLTDFMNSHHATTGIAQDVKSMVIGLLNDTAVLLSLSRNMLPLPLNEVLTLIFVQSRSHRS